MNPNIYYTSDDIKFIEESKRKRTHERNHPRKIKNNCICDNPICSNEFYRPPCEIAGAKHNYCSIKCKDEGRDIYVFTGTITLFKDGHRSGTARFHSKDQLKSLMNSMYSPGEFETYFSIKFKSIPEP